jgi:serine/threonine protein kinase
LAELTAGDSDDRFARERNRPDSEFTPSPEILDRISGHLLQRLSSISAGDDVVVADDWLPTGFDLEGYELLERIGAGGMGVVYRARHARLDRIVAVKVLDVEQFPGGGRIARFERESKAIGRLKHPNIVHAQDAGQFGQYHYLVMEFVEGANLEQLLRRTGTLRVPDACELIRQAAVGLEHCHQAGLVHRDIKPSNIMLAHENGQPMVKLLDLGLALITGTPTEPDAGLTRAGRIVGTIDYMAPEQFGGKTIDIRADIYSLGATLFALIDGKSPVEAVGTNWLERIASRMRHPPRSLATCGASVPRELVALVDSMLDPNPSARPATPGDVAAGLALFCATSSLDSLLQVPSATGDTRSNSLPFATRPDRSNGKRAAGPVQGTSRRAVESQMERSVKFAIVIVSILTLAVAAFFLTDFGSVQISADRAIQVELVRDNSVAKQLKVGPTSTRVWTRSGDYEVWIPEQPHERILITPNRFALTRGMNKQITIAIEPAVASKVEPAEDSRVDPGRSSDLTRTGVVLLFRNEGNLPVDCNFVDFAGHESLYARLEAGQTASAGAAHGHLFRFRRSDNQMAFYVTRPILDQTCVISDQAGMLTVSGVPTPTLEFNPDTYFHLHAKRFPELALSVRGGASANLGLEPAFATNNQLFRFAPAQDGWYFIESRLRRNMVLTMVNPGQARQANLFLLPKVGDGTSAQRFHVFAAEEGHVRIVSALGKLFHLTLASDERDVVPGIYVGDATTFLLREYHGREGNDELDQE